MSKIITMIPVEKIYPHPNNPRTQLGDISELTDSIRAMGILQNLTVVPYDPAQHTAVTVEDPSDSFVAVIGHRRHAAAKAAGLSEVPCFLETMDLKTQVETMLLENGQREDLTAYEEAMGYQLLLDLGETVDTIAQKTGLSNTTIRKRVKLLELDRDKFAAATERGATLSDYAELDKIKDIALKNEVLDTIGTKNFAWSLKNAIDKEKSKKRIEEIVSEVKAFAAEVESDEQKKGLIYLYCYWTHDKKQIEVPADLNDRKYFYTVSSSSVNIYTDKPAAATAEDIAKAQYKADVDRRENLLKDATDRAYQLRQEFVKNLSNTIAKKNLDLISSFVTAAFFTKDFCNLSQYKKNLTSIMNIPWDDDARSFSQEDCDAVMEKTPEYGLLCVAYTLSDAAHYKFWASRRNGKKNRYELEYDGCDELDRLYAFLEKLGYTMSDEELMLQNGTHPALNHEEAEEAQEAEAAA
jgi:ParB family chromosome partitioning protein